MIQLRLWVWRLVGPAESHVPWHPDGGDGDQGQGVWLCHWSDQSAEVTTSWTVHQCCLPSVKRYEVCFSPCDSMGLMLYLLGTCPISLRRANWPRCSFFTQILTSKKQNTSNQKIMNNRWKINLISKVEDYQSFSISWVCLCSGSRWKSLHCHRRRRPLWVDD